MLKKGFEEELDLFFNCTLEQLGLGVKCASLNPGCTFPKTPLLHAAALHPM